MITTTLKTKAVPSPLKKTNKKPTETKTVGVSQRRW
jgi:hypothetical protein